MGLAGGDEALDQPDRIRVFGEIPHRPVAAGIEDRVEIGLLDTVEANRPGELRLLRGSSALKRRVSSVWNIGSSLLGSSGGWPPLGDASVISAPASLKT